MKLIVFSLTALFLITSCQYKNKPNIEKIKVSSKDFSEGKTIPARFTCVDKNISPDISLQPTPNGTKSFAVITDNPDAPSGNFVHWVIYNIPSNVNNLPENQPITEKLDNGSFQAKNSFNKTSYNGPCPPNGVHRYFFKVYAIDKTISFLPNADKEVFLKEVDGNIIGQGELMGTFSK